MTRHRTTYRGTRNPHGLYAFCCGVIIATLILVAIALLVAVNR
jgi:hypothetical protein